MGGVNSGVTNDMLMVLVVRGLKCASLLMVLMVICGMISGFTYVHVHGNDIETSSNRHQGSLLPYCAGVKDTMDLDWFYNEFPHTGQVPSLNPRTDYNILILTPIWLTENSTVPHDYFRLLCTLNYPHERITIALGIDSRKDLTILKNTRNIVKKVKSSFGAVKIYELSTPKPNWTQSARHSWKHQLQRRGHLALARNNLLSRALQPKHDWVVWMDSDLVHIPPDLIQLLLSPNQPIVAPSCVWREPNKTFDRNTWRETPASLKHISQQKQKLGEDFLMMEGYGADHRLMLNDLRNESNVVKIDGVGGSVLLVNASCHRDGLVFPPFVFDSHIETEGLGKMATRMGINMVGLPLVQVVHSG